MPDITIPKSADPNGYQQLTVSSSAVAMTVPLNSNMADILVQDAGIRYRDDGTNPTSTVGTPLFQNQSMQIIGASNLSAIKFIRSGASDAIVNINYYKL